MKKTFATFGALMLAWACSSGGSEKVLSDDGGVSGDLTLDEAPEFSTEEVEARAEDLSVDEGQSLDKLEDIQFQDLIPDKTPPTIVKTEPSDGQTDVPIPFVIKVTFSEPIREQTIDKNTFKVQDLDDKIVPGTYHYDKDTYTVTFTPDKNAKILFASPYHVTLSTIIQDKAGNGLTENYYFWFATTLPPDMKRYEDLAARYAPIIYQETRKEAPHFDYLTSFDFDGNWLALDNFENLKKATSIPSYVYYDVVETKSHYFIRYVYFHPYRFDAGGQSFGNQASGATVVVAKYPQERPIAVMTYFEVGNEEQVRSYVTKESGIVGDKKPAYYGVNFVFQESELFPGGHYLAYLTDSTHESCLWVHTTKENPLDQFCLLTEADKTVQKYIQYVYDGGVSDAIKKESGAFPAFKQEVRYGLKPILRDFWTRRDQVGKNTIFTIADTYTPIDDRPGNGLKIPSAFLDPVDPSTGKGRPPWSWKWQGTMLPIDGQDFFVYEMPRGMYFLDPAYFFMKRHRLVANWNWDTKEGYSVDYCFNPYLLIDQRNIDPACKAQ